jgi:hypothetical protein
MIDEQDRILLELIRGEITPDEARAQLRANVENLDGTPLDDTQITTILANPEGFITPGISGATTAATKEQQRLAQETFLTGRQGRELAFQGAVGKALPRGASGFLRDPLEARFDIINTLFDLRSGLGDLPISEQGDPQGFGDFFSGAEVPSPETIQGLVRRAGNLILQDPTTLQQESSQLGFRRDLVDNPNQQFNLALQSVLRSVPLHLRGAFTQGARRLFGRSLTDAPEQSFLPGFINRGFRFGDKLRNRAQLPAQQFIGFGEQGLV